MITHIFLNSSSWHLVSSTAHRHSISSRAAALHLSALQLHSRSASFNKSKKGTLCSRGSTESRESRERLLTGRRCSLGSSIAQVLRRLPISLSWTHTHANFSRLNGGCCSRTGGVPGIPGLQGHCPSLIPSNQQVSSWTHHEICALCALREKGAPR